MVKELVLKMNSIVDVSDEQQEMLVKIIEMHKKDEDYSISRRTENTEWELVRRFS